VPRLDELRTSLDPLEAEDIRLDVIADDPMTEIQVRARYTAYLAGLSDYIDWRDDQIDDGVDILQQTYSAGTTADTLNQQWTDFFLARGRDAADRLNRLADGVDARAPSLRPRARAVVSEETQFWAQIAAMPIAHAAGQLVAMRFELDTARDQLADKWEALGDQDDDLDDKIARATADLQGVLTKAVEQVVAEQRGLVSKVEGVRYDPQARIDDWKGALVALLKAAATVIFTQTEALKASTESYLKDLTTLHQQQDGVAVLFVQMRADVRGFLEQRRLRNAEELFDDASDGSRDLAGRCPTDQQRVDALAVAERAIDVVEPIVDALERSFKDFVDAFRDVFVGPVGPATIERLLEIEVRDREVDALADLDIEGRLQQLVDASAPTIFIDIDGISEEDRESVREVFLVEWKRLAEGLVAAKNDHLTQRVAQVVSDFSDRAKQKLLASPGGEP